MNRYEIFFGLIFLLSGLFLLGGCTETIPGVPFTAGQFISRLTDLNYTVFSEGGYDGNFVVFDGNKFGITTIDINSADIDWSQLINFPSGCSDGQAVKIVGSSLVCVDLTTDTNYETAGYDFGDYALLDGTNQPFTGDIEISTSTPKPLTLTRTSDYDSYIYYRNNLYDWTFGMDADKGFVIAESDAITVNPRFVVENGGDIGIGTNTPDADLEIIGTKDFASGIGSVHLDSGSSAFFSLDSAGNTYDSGITFAEGGTGQMDLIFDASENQFAIRDATDSYARRMVIDQTGKVGINITDPDSYISSASNLVVGNDAGHSGITISAKTDSASQLIFADASTKSTHVGSLQYFHDDDHLEFNVNGSEAMRIDSSGNLGIGVEPTTNLTVEGEGISIGGFYTQMEVRSTEAFAQGVGGGITLDGRHTTTGMARLAAIKSLKKNGVSNEYGGQLGLYTREHGGALTANLIVDDDGDVFIPNGQLGVGVNETKNSFDLAYDSTTPPISIRAGSPNSQIMNNGYYNSGWKYFKDGYAWYIGGYHPDTEFQFNVADTGLEGNTITWDNTLSIDYLGNYVSLPKDDLELLLGEAKDSSISYNGTDMIINPKSVGSGILEIQGDTKINEDLNIVGNVYIDGNVYYEMPHLYGIADTTQALGSTSVWQGIDFNFLRGDVHEFSAKDSNCIIVHQAGHYIANMEAHFEDASPAPNANIGLRISQNGVEVDGSYTEEDSAKQNADLEITTFGYIRAEKDDVLCMEWTSDDADVSLMSDNTFATGDVTAKGFIDWVHP